MDHNKDFNGKLEFISLGEIIPQAPAQTIRAVLEDNGEITPCELDSHGFIVDDDASAIVDSQTLSCRLRAGPMLSKSSTTKNGKTNSSEELQQLYDNLVDKFGELSTDGKNN